MFKPCLVISCLAALLVGVATPANALSDDTDRVRRFVKETTTVASVVALPPLPDGSFEELDGTTLLARTKTGVGFTFNTSALQPRGAYTVWWVAFNRPRKCLTPYACGADDFGNPAAEVGIFFATGRVADGYGQAGFSGQVDYGELPQGYDQVPFPGLDHPIRPGAEIHLVIRDHGPAQEDPDALAEQLTQFNGGCPPYDCVDVQVSVHGSPKHRIW